VSGLNIDGGTIGPGIGNFAGGRQGIKIKDGHMAWHRAISLNGAAGNVKAASRRVRLDVVESAQAADFGGFQNLIRSSGILRQPKDRQGSNCDSKSR
jgi:hypothetical protein